MLEYRERWQIIQRNFKRLDVVKAVWQLFRDLLHFIFVAIPLFLIVMSIVQIVYAVKWVFRKLSNMV
jgi:hypothetical protein